MDTVIPSILFKECLIIFPVFPEQFWRIKPVRTVVRTMIAMNAVFNAGHFFLPLWSQIGSGRHPAQQKGHASAVGNLNLCGAGETITASAAEIAGKIFFVFGDQSSNFLRHLWLIIHKGKKFIQFLFSLYPPDGENMVILSDKSGSGSRIGNEPSRKGFHSNKAHLLFFAKINNFQIFFGCQVTERKLHSVIKP